MATTVSLVVVLVEMPDLELKVATVLFPSFTVDIGPLFFFVIRHQKQKREKANRQPLMFSHSLVLFFHAEIFGFFSSCPITAIALSLSRLWNMDVHPYYVQSPNEFFKGKG